MSTKYTFCVVHARLHTVPLERKNSTVNILVLSKSACWSLLGQVGRDMQRGWHAHPPNCETYLRRPLPVIICVCVAPLAGRLHIGLPLRLDPKLDLLLFVLCSGRYIYIL